MKFSSIRWDGEHEDARYDHFLYLYGAVLRSKGFLWTTLITVVLIGSLLWIPKLVSEFSSGEKGTVLVEDPLKLVSGAEELSKGVSADYRWEPLNGDKRESALERLKQEEEVKGVVTLGEAGGLPVLDIAVRKKDDLPLVEELTRFVRERLTLRQMDELSLTQRQKERADGAARGETAGADGGGEVEGNDAGADLFYDPAAVLHDHLLRRFRRVGGSRRERLPD
ncbi:hypothetical protein LJK87_09360 [Paenibacillus sp. P25]|nr:hypothetical protein LJK87_09360 [Paenibacillus sp. P25]